MFPAYLCLLIAALLPYVWVGLAKSRKGYNNYAPRLQQAKLEGWRARAHWAQLNSYEALPPFIAAVLTAVQTGAPAATVNLAAEVFIVARVLHGVFYIANLAWQRSLAWFAGISCVLWLFVEALRRVA